MQFKFLQKHKGLSLIEILLALTIFALTAGAIFTLHFMNGNAIDNSSKQEQAYNYALEGLEIVKNIKQESFFTLATGNYGLSETTGTYSLVADTTETIDIYERTIAIDDVYRDDANQIDPSGANLDSLTKRITVTISWVSQFGRNNSVVLQEYFSDWSGTSWVQTTQTQFNTGTPTDTLIVESDLAIPDNGAVELAEVVGEDIVYFDTVDVLERAQDIAASDNNYLYAAVAKSNQGFCSIDFTDPQNPTVEDCIDVEGHGLSVVVDGDYAYVAVDDSDEGLAIVDISDPANLNLIESLDIDGDGLDVVLQDDHLYVATHEDDAALTIINVSNPLAPFITSATEADDEGLGVHIDGNYAYLTTDNAELFVYDVSNPNSPNEIAQLNLAEDSHGGSIQGNYLFLTTNISSSAVQVVNIADPQNPFIVTSLTATADAHDADILNDILFVSVRDNANGLHLYNITDPVNPTLIDTVDIQGKGRGVDATEGYVFIATDTQTQGIAMATTGSLEVAPSGTYLSAVHDTSLISPNYQNISWVASEPPGTTLQFQVRTADTVENIETATFVGPDGTNTTYYTTTPSTVTLDPSRTGDQFIQWQASMTSDGNSTPAIEEVTIKYE